MFAFPSELRSKKMKQFRFLLLYSFAFMGLLLTVYITPGASAARPASVAKSSFPKGQAVHLPCEIDNGLVYINARIGQKTVRCQIDTGCYDINWPVKLKLEGRDTHKWSYFKDVYNRAWQQNEMILPRIDIGGYVLTNVSTEQIWSSDGPLATAQNSLSVAPALVLGNPAFAHTVLTIDYRQKQVVISPTYNPTTSYPTHVFKIISLPIDNKDGAAFPEITGYFNAQHQFKRNKSGGFELSPSPDVETASSKLQPIKILIDTGWSEDMGLSANFYAQIQTSLEQDGLMPQMKKFLSASTDSPAYWNLTPAGYEFKSIPYLCFSLEKPDSIFVESAFIDAGFIGGHDINIGPDRLGLAILTIDYMHSKIYLTYNNETL